MGAMDDGAPLAPSIGVSPSRWYLVLLYGMATLWQATIFNSCGPIDSSLKTAYPDVWTDGQIAMQGNWGSILYTIFFLPTPILMRKYGLRFVIIGGVVLMWLGAGLRCLSVSSYPFLILCHVCSILNGISGALQLVVIPAYSARWFPNHERTTATSIVAAMNNMGIAVSFFLPNILVPDDSDGPLQRWYIQRFMLVEFAISSVLLLAFLVYFPERPPKPPSLTSGTVRLGSSDSLRNFVKSPLAWALTVVFGLSLGPNGVFSAVMNVDLQSLGEPEWSVNSFGWISVIATCTVMMTVSFVTDRFVTWLKTIVFFLLATSCIFYAWFIAIYIGWLHADSVTLYSSIGCALTLNYCAFPLLMELTSEALYPVEESVAAAFLTGAQNLVGVVYMSMAVIPGLGAGAWMNYALLACVGASLPILALCRVEYKRSNVDETVEHLEVEEESVAVDDC